VRNEFGGIYRDETTRVWRPSGRRGPVRTDVLPHRVGVLATSWGHWAGAGGMRGQFALLADGRVTFSRDSSAPWSQVTPYRAAAAELANVALCRRDRGRGSVYAPNLLVRLTSGQEQGR
jgi:hypothetical protein